MAAMRTCYLSVAVVCSAASAMPSFINIAAQRPEAHVQGERHRSDRTGHRNAAPVVIDHPDIRSQAEFFRDASGHQATGHHLAPGTCLGFDLCVPNKTKKHNAHALQLSLVEDLDLDFPRNVPEKKGCSAEHDVLDKTMLLPIVPYFHGITALDSVFMSSPKVATLCRAGTWQCEARFHDPNKAIREKLLETYGSYWDMDRHLLLEKGPRGNFSKVHREYFALRGENSSTPLKHHALQKEVNLRLAYIIMWQPVCLSQLSSRRSPHSADRETFAIDELLWLEDLVIAHQWLRSQGLHPLVVNLGDVLWKPTRTIRRLQEFLPCLGEVDLWHRPEMNKDIFPGNDWEADASIAEFARSVDPVDCCGYDVRSGHCSDEHDFFDALPGFRLKGRAKRAVAYLKKHS